MSSYMAVGIKMFRIMDIFAAAVGITSLALRIKPILAFPVIFVLYGAPVLVVRDELSLAVWLSAVPASLPSASAWRRQDVCRTSFATFRLAVIWTMVGTASFLDM